MLTGRLQSLLFKKDSKGNLIPTGEAGLKDLIRLDGCQEELKLTQNKVIKLEEREIQKDTIISLLKDKDKNNQFIISQKDKQLQISDELSKSLGKELKISKRTTFLYKLGTVVGIITTSFLLITK
jgi:hypothetical protein